MSRCDSAIASQENTVRAAVGACGFGRRYQYDTSVAAETMVAKYTFNLLVYRQQDVFASHG
jgi:hypothetical protein